tara:strand:+ start:1344 stop:2015 length:672 start_codon:yes stop_codon:yes gene_type:complete
MKKIIASLLASAALVAPVSADPLKDSEYFTMHSMGCMLLQECIDEVEEITSILDVSSQYSNTEQFYSVANEFNNMLSSLNAIGVKVFLADQKYFPVSHRGVYHTVGNNFFLNKAFMGRPNVLMSVMRHEGWHAAQDCMAGTIDNSLIAIIKPEDEVPMLWRDMVESAYPESAWPWEKEATWAGKTEGMTMNALAACANGNMWEVYEPTPLTREYLVKEGYITK